MKAGGLDEDTVNGDDVTGFDVHDVADEDVVYPYLLGPARTHNGDLALLVSFIELLEFVVLLPVVGGGSENNDDDGNDDGDSVYPLNIGRTSLADGLVYANGEGDGGGNRKQDQ